MRKTSRQQLGSPISFKVANFSNYGIKNNGIYFKGRGKAELRTTCTRKHITEIERNN